MAQLSSRGLATSLVAAYAVISAAVGTVLLVAKPPVEQQDRSQQAYVYETLPDDSAWGQPAPDVVPPPMPTGRPTAKAVLPGAPPSSAPKPVPSAPPPATKPLVATARVVSGPGGLTTTIPTDWPVTKVGGPGALQATDPADPDRVLRFGGSTAPGSDLLTSHLDYERTVSVTRPGFRRLSMTTTTFHGVPAVEWDFIHDGSDGPRRVKSRYWRVAGTEYFLYAAADADRWAETEKLYRTMIETATP